MVPGAKVNREPERRALEAMRVLLELGANVNAADKCRQHRDARGGAEAVRERHSVSGRARGPTRTQETRGAKRRWRWHCRPTPPPPGTQVATQGLVLKDEGPKIAEVLRQLGAKE